MATTTQVKTTIQGVTALLALFFCAGVAASSVSYNVSSTGSINCRTGGQDAPHGLWTNRFKAPAGRGSCKQFYDFQPDSSLDVKNGKARLKATAINPQGVIANIDFSFAKPKSADNWNGVVKNGGNGNPDDWSFYKKGKGKIDISYDKKYRNKLYKVTHKFKLDLANKTAFQFGVGANDKTGVLGASAWLDINKWAYSVFVYQWDKLANKWQISSRKWGKVWTGFDRVLGSHWDLNMELSPVPIPAAIWFFITGLLGLAGYNSRKRHGVANAS